MTASTLDVPAYQPPSLRITANYPFSDGSCPESIEIEMDLEKTNVETISVIIGALAEVPTTRLRAISTHPLHNAESGPLSPAASRQI